MMKFLTKVVLQIKNATCYSKDGLIAAFQEEFAFRLETFTGIIAIPAAFFIGNTAVERIALISSILLIAIVELLNSAIEVTLNQIDLNWSALIKKAKDMGSAAVMLAIINALIVWTLIIATH